MRGHLPTLTLALALALTPNPNPNPNPDPNQVRPQGHSQRRAWWDGGALDERTLA